MSCCNFNLNSWQDTYLNLSEIDFHSRMPKRSSFFVMLLLAKNLSIFYPFLENLTTDIAIGQVDPREVISLFPRMLPSSSNFTRAIPSLHDIADINQVIFILIVLSCCSPHVFTKTGKSQLRIFTNFLSIRSFLFVV